MDREIAQPTFPTFLSFPRYRQQATKKRMLENIVSSETDPGGNASFSLPLETWKFPGGNGNSAIPEELCAHLP